MMHSHVGQAVHAESELDLYYGLTETRFYFPSVKLASKYDIQNVRAEPSKEEL
jgi:hypothetical protein